MIKDRYLLKRGVNRDIKIIKIVTRRARDSPALYRVFYGASMEIVGAQNRKNIAMIVSISTHSPNHKNTFTQKPEPQPVQRQD